MTAFTYMQSTLDGALECARRGWHVFPAKIEDGKKKSFKSAKYSEGRNWGATTDPEEIRRDWAQWPEALLGVVTGPKSGFFVVEADTMDGHGVDGIANLEALINEHGDLPHTIEATSPSGSRHLYFRYPDGAEIKNSTSAIAPGIDVRGDGGMVIAPPSYRSDKDAAYTWSNPPGFFELADCPEWLLDMTLKPRPSGRIAPVADYHCNTGQPHQNREAGLDELAELLRYIDPDAGGYHQWCEILMAIHDHTGGGADGLSIADQWSARGAKYQSGEVASKWRTFTSGGGTTIASIAAVARQNGADLSEIARKYRTGDGGNKTTTSAATSDGRTRPNAPDEIDLSHDALASDLGVRSFDLDARHVAPWGKWLFWDGNRWVIDERLEHMTRTRAFLRDRADELTIWAENKANTLDTNKGDKVRNWAKEQSRNLRNKITVASVEALARSNPASVASAGDFDGNPLLLGTPGGTVDLRTGELRPARRDDMITKLTACAPSNPGTRPERWLDFLHEIFDGDIELVEFMQRAAGYALTGLTTEHRLLFLYGTGRNGKSVFLNTLSYIWADYARRAAAETFLNTIGDKHATGIAGLQGARLVVGSELPRGRSWDESVIKDLTGGDRMTARFMRGDFFDFDPQLTLMIAGNNQPSFRGVDEAIRARVVLVPFLVTIPPERRDKALGEKLKAEGPAILRWAIDGALEWQRRGLVVPASVTAASEEYMDDEDTLAQFLADETVPDPASFITTSDLHQLFRFWCERQGLATWTSRTLQKEMKSRGWQYLRRNHGRGFLGLRAKG